MKKIIVNWQCMGWAWGGGGCGYYVLEKLYSIGCIGMGWGGAGLGIICIENDIVALQCMGWGWGGGGVGTIY